MIDLTQIVIAVITLSATVVAVKVVPFIRKKCSTEDLTRAAKWIEFAVKAAEQMAESGEIEKSDKFEWVLDFIRSKGFDLSWDDIKVIIEAKVGELPKLLTAELNTITDVEDQDEE